MAIDLTGFSLVPGGTERMAWKLVSFDCWLVWRFILFASAVRPLRFKSPRAAAGGLTVGTVAGHVNQSKLQDRPPLLRTSNRT
jgi:hypothetical protein